MHLYEWYPSPSLFVKAVNPCGAGTYSVRRRPQKQFLTNGVFFGGHTLAAGACARA